MASPELLRDKVCVTGTHLRCVSPELTSPELTGTPKARLEIAIEEAKDETALKAVLGQLDSQR